MATISEDELEALATAKSALFKEFLLAEPPNANGESLLELWRKIYDDDVKNTVVDTVSGPSDDVTNPVFPYEKLYSIIGDGVPNSNWKWPRMWQKLDEMERRGPAFRKGEKLNFDQANKNPNIHSQKVLVVGGGPVGLRMAIELSMGGHKATIYEKRRELTDADGNLTSLGFTNRINRPHMWPFVRNDLARLNGKDFMSSAVCYPVFTEPDTSSIGIDELQILLMKNALMLGVDFCLGVGFDDATTTNHPQSMKPLWDVQRSVDKLAAEHYGMPEGKSTVKFDCVVGCDGPRSTVRQTQAKYFGDIERRKFMDCVGIVANVAKVSRSRLKALGFEYGQEPKDMNRTTMVFRDFFAKIKTEAKADLENFIYYKASHHYYIILTPKRANLIEHGLSGRVYSFAEARGRDPTEAQLEKQKLKVYVTNVLKAAGIPVDDTQDNGGFVAIPNDVMAFDFAECWNTKKSMALSYPPVDYNVAEHGKWKGKKLSPFIALAGDALLEPFWPMGLGLKRGWQAIMDTAYAIDNIYNRTMFAESLSMNPDEVDWETHFTALEDQIGKNFEYCNRLKVSDDLGKGEYDAKGNVMMQITKKLKDAEKPMFLVEVDPWTRYAPLAMEREAEWKKKFLEDEKQLHPVVSKAIAMKAYYDSMTNGKEVAYVGKEMVTLNGKTLKKEVSGYVFKAPTKRKSTIVIPPVVAEKPPVVNLSEIQGKSNAMQASLLTAVLSKNVDDHVAARSTTRKSIVTESAKEGTLGNQSAMAEIGHLPPSHADGLKDATEAMWDRMHGKHLSPAQTAELDHIRNMITALGKSLESYKQAEKELMMK